MNLSRAAENGVSSENAHVGVEDAGIIDLERSVPLTVFLA